MHLYWQELAWDCYTLFFTHLYQSYGPWFMPKFRFRSISWEIIDRISQNSIDAYILTRSTLGLTHFIFDTFTPEWWPFAVSTQYLENARMLFPLRLNILRTNTQNFTKFYTTFILTRSSFGMLHVIFCKFVQELWPLIYAKISFQLNNLATNW